MACWRSFSCSPQPSPVCWTGATAIRLPHRVPKPLHQALQQTAAALLVLRGFKLLRVAAAAKLYREPARSSRQGQGTYVHRHIDRRRPLECGHLRWLTLCASRNAGLVACLGFALGGVRWRGGEHRERLARQQGRARGTLQTTCTTGATAGG